MSSFLSDIFPDSKEATDVKAQKTLEAALGKHFNIYFRY